MLAKSYKIFNLENLIAKKIDLKAKKLKYNNLFFYYFMLIKYNKSYIVIFYSSTGT